MCGICGIASGRDAVDRERLGRMAATLVHRGPDSEGMHVDGPVGIAARRLAIIDLTGGDQPIANEDGSVRGRAERRDLQLRASCGRSLERAGHVSATRDTEVIVHGYEWGSGLARPPARHVRRRGLGRAPCAADAGARPLRHQAALLPRRRRRALVCLGARRAAARRGRPRRARGVPRVQRRAGPALDLPRHPQAAARAHAHLGERREHLRPVRATSARSRHATTRTRRNSSRNAAPGSATPCEPT